MLSQNLLSNKMLRWFMYMLKFMVVREAAGAQETCRRKEITRTYPSDLNVSLHKS